MYYFRTIDVTGRSESMTVGAVDDDDAIRLGQLCFEAEVGLILLEVEDANGTPVRAFVKDQRTAL